CHAASSDVRTFLWNCHELGLAYRHCDAAGASLTATLPGYFTINPGTVPTFDNDGFTLWGSNAIIRYLGDDTTFCLEGSNPRHHRAVAGLGDQRFGQRVTQRI